MCKVKSFYCFLLFIICSLQLSSQTGTTISDSIISGSIYRKFRLYVPTSYNSSQAVPLLFNLHGYTSNATQQQLYGNFMPIADTANFIMVLPEGTAPAGSQYFNAGFGPGVNDVLFMSDLIDSLKLNYNINNNAIYSCGMSNGGIMSYYLACNLPNRFAAIASVTGSMLNSWFTSSPNRAFPVMEIHGTNDATVPYIGSSTFAHIDSVVKKWVLNNNCNISPATFSVPNTVTTDGATAINFKYTGGTNAADVELYRINNGAHTWPGAPIAIGVTCMDFNASVEIWRFFRRYKLNMFVTAVPENKNDLSINVFPNPANEFITISDPGNTISELKITSLLGEIFIVQKSSSVVNLSNLPQGVYVIRMYKNNDLVTTKKIVIAR